MAMTSATKSGSRFHSLSSVSTCATVAKMASIWIVCCSLIQDVEKE